MHETIGDVKGVLEISWLTYAWVGILSFLGGLANYVNKVKAGTSRFNLMEVLGELIVSGFSGLMTFYLCSAAHTPEVVTAAAVGMSGHLGARAITIIELYISKKMGLPTKDQAPRSKD